MKDTIPEHVERLINAGLYKDSIDYLRARLAEYPVPGLLSKLNQTESTYKYLLQYFAQGAQDPGRNQMLGDIRMCLFGIAQQLQLETKANDSSQQFFATLRMNRLRPLDIKSSIHVIIEKNAMAQLAFAAGSFPDSVISDIEEEEAKLFDAIWVADSIPDETYSFLANEISSAAIPVSAASLIISAAALGLMQSYSYPAFSMLCQAASSSDISLSARAIVSLILCLDKWKERISSDRRMIQRLETLVDEEGMPQKLRNAVYILIKTRDTDRISKKMSKEVIPGLMQFGPDILKRMKDASKESSFADFEGNPEWEELLKNSGLEEKLMELNEMQTDGADVMMAAFSNLKGFPFFRQLRNWLLPFSIQHSMLCNLREIDEGLISSLLEINGLMCNSDKFSFAFSLASMPDLQRQMVFGQMKAQAEQIQQQLQQLESVKAHSLFDEEVTKYCRDLYRFHKLYPKRAEFYDPFAGFTDFQNIHVLKDLFGKDELLQIAEFLFKRGYYADAFPLLENLSRLSSDIPHLWEKIGFCYEKMSENVNLAVEAYMKAQLFNPDSRWIARRLGLCYRKLGDFPNALEYLKLSLPDNGGFDRRMALMIADTMMSAHLWTDALKELQRIDYENPDDCEVLRRMAQCAFMSNDLDKSRNLILAIPEIELSEDDRRLLGHICFLNHDMPGAIQCYRQTIRPNDRQRLWISSILSDLDLLVSMGGNRNDMSLLLEALAYSLQ